MAVGIAWAVAFVVWAACKYGGTVTTTTTTEEVEEQPAYKETKVTISSDAIKDILKEMGYPKTVGEDQLRAQIEEILTRNYTEFMKKVEAKAAAVRDEVEKGKTTS